MNKEHLTDEYQAYLLSDRWALKRAAALARTRYRCQKCDSRYQLEVHHRTYERFGEELPEDLEVLCEGCHDKEHKQQSARRLWNARLDGWATKVYGDDWDTRVGWPEVEEAFEAWLGEDET